MPYIIPPKIYDILKWMALVFLPALGTLYFALAGIWGLSSAQEVVGTIVAVDTFLGVVLQISSANYKSNAMAGVINIHDRGPDQAKLFSLDLDGDPSNLEGQKVVQFKVRKDHTGASGVDDLP